MKDFVRRMIDEHRELVARIERLEVYLSKENDDDKYEFANKCIQLSAMKKYEECLRARLNNQGVFVENGAYFEIYKDELPACKYGKVESAKAESGTDEEKVEDVMSGRWKDNDERKIKDVEDE